MHIHRKKLINQIKIQTMEFINNSQTGMLTLMHKFRNQMLSLDKI